MIINKYIDKFADKHIDRQTDRERKPRRGLSLSCPRRAIEEAQILLFIL